MTRRQDVKLQCDWFFVSDVVKTWNSVSFYSIWSDCYWLSAL